LDCRLKNSADLGRTHAGIVCDASYGHLRAGFITGVLEFFDRRIYIQAYLSAVLFQCQSPETPTGSTLEVPGIAIGLSIIILIGSAA